MKTRINHTSWKRLMLGLTAFSFLLMGGIVSAAPTGTSITVALPTLSMDTTVPISTVIVQPITTTNIDPNLHFIGFQGDFTFNETVCSFVPPVVQAAGLTGVGWTVSGNVLPGPGPIRTLRVSAFVNDGLTPLSGAGTLYNLRMIRVGTTPPLSTTLTWKPDPDNFLLIDDNLNTFSPTQTNGSVTVTGPTPTPGGPTPTPTPTPTPPVGPTPTPGPVTVSLPTTNLDPSVPISTVVLQPVTTTNVTGLDYIGFQGDFTFDETVCTFSSPFVEASGLTGSGWTVAANIIPGPGPIRTLRVSAFTNDGTTALVGAGTLYNLRLVRVSTTPPAATLLAWKPDPDNFLYIDSNLDAHAPAQTNGVITVCAGAGSCPTPTPPPPPTPSPTPSPSPTATASPTPTATPTASPTASPSPTATATATASATSTPTCPTLITQSTSQTVTPGSVSCNAGSPNFFHADNSYWRAFNMMPVTGGAAYNVSSVDFGIEQATANPAVGNQPVTVRLHVQTAGTFPAGTWTQIATATVNVTNQMATVLSVPISATVPAGTTQLIMEVFTPNGQAPINNTFFIGSNAATQTGPSYISAATCGLTVPTDAATIGFPNMHIVFNVHGGCGPTPTPGTPTPSPTAASSCPPVITESTSQTVTPGSASCNGGSPNFFHADSSYWRAFNVSGFTVGTGYNISSVSFGIETATANPAVGTQPVIVRLHRQTAGTFPAGTWTQIATTTVNVANQMGTVLVVPITAFVPPGSTQLIMEVNTPNGQNPVNNSFFIGSNGLGQSAPSYISAATCSLNTPTDVSTIGFPNMHMVFNVNGLCGPSPTPTVAPTASPSPSPSPSLTPIPSPTPTVTATPKGPTPTPCVGCPTPTPCASCPTPTPGGPTATPVTETINLSTRMRVDTGNSVAIGGFIITGSSAKRVIIRAIGPSLVDFGITDALADPILELHGENGFVTIINNNWRDNQEQEIIETGIAPTNDLESAIVGNLPPGSYTAVVKGAGNSNGVALVEIYDLNPQDDSKLGNLSTRAFVHTGNDIVIAGFLLSTGPDMDKIIVRGIGPSLADFFPGEMVLADPMLELRDSNGALLIENDNWADDPSQANLIIAAGLAPTNPAEAGLVAFLPPGGYTALLSGVNDTTGLSLVEIYDNPESSPTPTPGPTGTPGAATPTPPIGPTPTPPIGSTPTPPPVAPTPTPTPGQPTVCTENFDGVTAPALPPGWAASNPTAGDGVMFVTTTNSSDSAPNNAFIPDQDGISDKVLDRQMTINSASPALTFRNNFNSEFSDGVFWDGGVLEISTPNISGGEFLDFTDSHVGGICTAGCYTGELSGDASNPLAGRMAWSGNSGGYIDTAINLGPNLNGQTITLRFRFGSDEAAAATGWHIDGLSINGASCP